MSENEEEILKAALKLSFAEQCQHAHWKVRSRAYEMLSSFDDEKDEETTNDKNFEINYFKEAMHKIVSETNANALDVALERTNGRLRKMIDRELLSFTSSSGRGVKGERCERIRGRRWGESVASARLESVLRETESGEFCHGNILFVRGDGTIGVSDRGVIESEWA